MRDTDVDAIGRAWERVSQCSRFNKLMASGGGRAKQNRTLLDFNLIKKKMREDEENEQDDGEQG